MKDTLTDDQYAQLVKLAQACKTVKAFYFEGRLFKGNYIDAIKQYVTVNPSKSFYVWLQDTQTELTENVITFN